MNQVKWIKGICHILSRGRHLSSSMLEYRYLNLGSQNISQDRNLGEHRSVRRSGTAFRGTALLELCLRIRSFSRIEVLTISLRVWYPGSFSFPSDGRETVGTRLIWSHIGQTRACATSCFRLHYLEESTGSDFKRKKKSFALRLLLCFRLLVFRTCMCCFNCTYA